MRTSVRVPAGTAMRENGPLWRVSVGTGACIVYFDDGERGARAPSQRLARTPCFGEGRANDGPTALPESTSPSCERYV